MENRRRVRSLAHRHALQVGLLATGALLLSGLMEMYFSYREAITQTQVLQATQATAAAREIEQYLQALTDALRDTGKSPWGAAGFTPQRRRDEYRRVMVLYPAVSEIQVVGTDKAELMFLSRSEPDRIAAQGWDVPAATAQAVKPAPVTFGMPYFGNGSEPYVQIEFGAAAQEGARVIATLHLRLVADVLQRLDDAVAGQAYLVDAQNRLILHPVQTEMLKQRRLDDWPSVVAARAALAAKTAQTLTFDTVDFSGKDVISTATFLSRTGWLLFLEQPRSVVIEPAIAALWRTALLVALAALLTAVVSAWSGRRMAKPVVELRRASARIAGGDFESPVTVKTGDELELLAEDLNQMADRLKRFYEELETQVAVRTRELLQARDTAERASQAKTRFLAAASHDLRQPMHTIGLLVGVLAAQLHNAEQLAIAAKLDTSVDTMERLFSSLLDISKLDAGAVRTQVQPFAIQDVLDRLAERFDVSAAERGLRLRVHCSAAIVRSDPGLLERCLGNLVANAVTYTATGRVVVGCRRRGAFLAIQVHDSGPGIVQNHLDDIFEEFVRLPAADAAQSRGLGLGLAIVRRTAALLEHPVRVHSRIGHGSMFEICVGLLPTTMPRIAAQSLQPGPAHLMQNMFVFIVDDDDGNRAALQALCSGWGCHVAAAASGESALDELPRHLRSPDIVLTDLKLGDEMDGLALIAKLRDAVEECTPCILITADTSAAVLEQAQASGIMVLHKPATAERLYAAACSLLHRPSTVSV